MYSRPYLIASLWFGEKSHGMQRVKMNSIHAEPMLAAASLLCDSWQPVLSRMTDPKRGKRHISTMGGSLVCLLLLFARKVTKRKRHVRLINQLKLTKWGQKHSALQTMEGVRRCKVIFLNKLGADVRTQKVGVPILGTSIIIPPASPKVEIGKRSSHLTI